MIEDKAPRSVWGRSRRMSALGPVWVAGHDDGAAAETLGTWCHDGVLVTAVFDRLRAFDVGTGRQLWSWRLPDRDVVAGMSAEVVDGVALVAHRPDSVHLRTRATVTALHLTSGRVVWSSVRLDFAEHRSSGMLRGILAHVGRYAVVDTGRQVVGLDAGTGRQEWATPHGPGTVLLLPAADRLFVVMHQGETAMLDVIDAADGRVLRRGSLRVDGPVEDVRPLGTDPLVVAVRTQGRRGEGFLLEVDQEGTTTRALPLGGGSSAVSCAFYLADPVLGGDGDTVAAFVKESSDYLLAGYSLSQGRRLWATEDYGYAAIRFHRGYVVTAGHLEMSHEGESFVKATAHVLDPADGRQVALRRLKRAEDEPFTVHMHGDRLLWVAKESGSRTPPVRAYDWR